MGTTTLTLEKYLATPTAQLVSATTDYIPKWHVDLGENAPPGTIIEAQYTLSTDTGFNNIIGTQVATADEGSLLDGIHDWINEPSLVNGNYIYRFKSRYRGMQSPDWSVSYPVTINANYGIDPAPILTNPLGTTTGDNTATFTVDTDRGDGLLYFGYQSTPAAPNPNDFILTAPSVAVTSTGTKTINVTGLTKNSGYYPVFVQVSQAGRISNVAVGERFVTTDSTPPVVSSGVVTDTSPTTADLTVQCDQPNVTVSVVATSSATQPTATQIETGKDHTNASVAAGRFKSQAVANAGQIVFNNANAKNFSALTAGAANYFHIVARDELAQPSNILTVAKTMPVAPDATPPTIIAVGAAAQSATSGIAQLSTNEGNGTARFMLTTTNSKPSIATIEASGVPVTVTAVGFVSNVHTGLTTGQLYYAWGFQRDQAGNPAADVIALGSFTPVVSVLEPLTIEAVHIPDASKPQFTIEGSIPQIGDEFRMSWNLPTPGFVDATIAATNLGGNGIGAGWQFVWNGVPSFPKNIAITFTIRHKRGSDTQQASQVVTFLDTPNVVSPPVITPPPPVDTNNYLVRKDSIAKYLRRDGVSRVLAR